MTDQLNIRLNPNAEIRQHPISDNYFAIVMDDFLLNPEDIVEYAIERKGAFEMPHRSYPGDVLDLDQLTFSELSRFIRSTLSKIFSFARGDILDTCQLCITTLQPKEFNWIQRLPHTDYRRDPGKDNYAILAYLFDNPALGGTGFYRFRDDNFWASVLPRQVDDPNGGLSIVQTRYSMFLDPPRYPAGSDQAVELITRIPAKFNRMVCYNGDVPHSAYITDANLLSGDCRSGRLTLNSFASVWPKGS